MSLGATRIVRLVPDDWRVHRDLRLTALRTDPQAFGATYADNAAYDEATWRARLEAVTYWQARDDADRPIGLVGLWDVVAEFSAPHGVDPAESGPFVIAMFVVPAARGAGVGAALLRTLLAEARARAPPGVARRHEHQPVCRGALRAARFPRHRPAPGPGPGPAGRRADHGPPVLIGRFSSAATDRSGADPWQGETMSRASSEARTQGRCRPMREARWMSE